MSPIAALAAPAAAPALAQLEALLALADPAGATPPLQACEAAAQARELAAALGREGDRLLAWAHRCTQLFRAGRHQQVVDEVLLLLRAAESATPGLAPLVRLDLLRGLALSASELARFDTALDAAQQAVSLAIGLGDDAAALTASFALGACLERMGDSWQAQRVIAQALKRCPPDRAPRQELVTVRNALCAVLIGLFHRLNGVAAPAEVAAVLQQAEEAGRLALQGLGSPPAPAQEVVICGNLGEVLMYQGRLVEAQALMQRSEATARSRGYVAYLWRLCASQGMLALLQGRAAEALQRLQALLAEMGDDAPQQTAVRAHHAAYQACRALGRSELALQHLEAYERLERQRATEQLRAQSELLVTRGEAQQAQWAAEQARVEAQWQRARAAEFAEHAERDPLTGLGNRRHFDRRCAELLPALQRDGEPAALALIDVDHFKFVNDAHGHAVGDRVLESLAALLRENTRGRDVVARYGGEEFVLVLPGMSLQQAAEVCERLRERVASHTRWCEQVPALRLTISLGLVAAPPYVAARLLEWADSALYRAKRTGRNRLCLAAPVAQG